MAAINITTFLSQPLVWENGDTLNYATVNTYVVSFAPGGPISDIRPVYAPGEDGGGTQNFGLRDSEHKIKLCYVQTSEMNCIENFDLDMSYLALGAFSMVVTDGVSPKTYDGCFISGGPEADQPKQTLMGATYELSATLSIKCVRP